MVVSWEGAGRSCIDIVCKAFILAVCYCWMRCVVVLNYHDKRGKLDMLALHVISHRIAGRRGVVHGDVVSCVGRQAILVCRDWWWCVHTVGSLLSSVASDLWWPLRWVCSDVALDLWSMPVGRVSCVIKFCLTGLYIIGSCVGVSEIWWVKGLSGPFT